LKKRIVTFVLRRRQGQRFPAEKPGMKMSRRSLFGLQGQRRYDPAQKWLILIFLTVCLAFQNVSTAHARTLLLGQTEERYAVSPYMEILRDPANHWSVDRLADRSFPAAFSPVTENSINLGLTADVHWLRFTVADQTANPEATGRTLPWIFDAGWPFVETLEAFSVTYDATGQAAIRKLAVAGSRCRLFREVPLRGCRSVFYLPRLDSVPATIYLRIVPNGHLALSPTLSSPLVYQENVAKTMLGAGLLLGAMMAAGLFGIVTYASLRERSYAWFALLTFFVAIFLALKQPVVGEFLFDFSMDDVHRLSRLAAGGAILALGCFLRSFMEDISGPIPRRLVAGLFIPGACLVVLAVSGSGGVPPLIFVFLQLAVVPFMVGAGFIVWQKGLWRRRFVFWTGLLATGAGFFHLLVLTGKVPYYGWLFPLVCSGGVGLLAFALCERIKVLHREREALRDSEQHHMLLAFTDGLTGLYNMRYFRMQLDLAIRRADQSNRPLTLIMMDIDNFKWFNDRHGHLEGDRVLRHLGCLIPSVIRDQDIACRYGGEEFAVILPDSRYGTAIHIHERMQKVLVQWEEETGLVGSRAVTLSVGVAEYVPGEDADDLIGRADNAMYAAKEGGRNRLVLSDGEKPADTDISRGYYPGM